uniref:Ig-like domain-containing protein n=1 Tax=Sinocyclocheilus anshuiensis TaxID=1608454 RepID=A0A671LAT3_9TELE
MSLREEEKVSAACEREMHSVVLYICVFVQSFRLSIKPAQNVFRGDTVTLRCDIDGEGVTSWQYSWYKDGSSYSSSELQEHTFGSVTESDAGKYSCYGAERGGSRTSNISDAVTLTVSGETITLTHTSTTHRHSIPQKITHRNQWETTKH